jgi:cytochrome c oxidase subunit 3
MKSKQKYNNLNTSRHTSRKALREEKLNEKSAQIFVWLIVLGIATVFVFLTISYFLTTYARGFHAFKLPILFHANTVLILVSSYILYSARKALQSNDLKTYFNGLLVTMVLGLTFVYFQVLAWQDLLEQHITLQSNIAGAYLYVISGLHILHVLVGVVWLIWLIVEAYEKQNDPIKGLLFEINEEKERPMKLLGVYWHFVDAVWIYLYLFILLMFSLAQHHI